MASRTKTEALTLPSVLKMKFSLSLLKEIALPTVVKNGPVLVIVRAIISVTYFFMICFYL